MAQWFLVVGLHTVISMVSKSFGWYNEQVLLQVPCDSFAKLVTERGQQGRRGWFVEP